MKKKEVKIITYHYVRDVEGGDFPCIKAISVEDFKRQIEWISKNGEVISQQQLIGAYEGNVELAENSYLLTFDDGYIEHALNVMPVLEEYGMSGVFFLPIKAVVERDVLNVNKIQFILGRGDSVKGVIYKIFTGLIKYRGGHDLKSDEEYWEECALPGRFDGPDVKFVKNMLQVELPEIVRENITNDLFEEYVSADQREFADKLYLKAEDAMHMKEKGMKIESHGYDHVWLGEMSKEEQERDIKKAVEQFGALGIDKDNWTMCYPYGSYNKDTDGVLKSFSCRAAYTTQGGVTQIKKTNRYQINRMDTTELMTEMKEISGPIVELGQI